MNKLLNLRTTDYEISNREFLKLFPTLKTKFRDQLTISGQKYDYIELSKVDITKDFTMIPSVFNTNKEDTHTLDCISIYCIGIMELLYITLIKDPSILTSVVSDLYKVLNIFDNYKDVSKLLNKLDIYNKKESLEIFNLAFVMKTDYNRDGYGLIKDYINVLMIIWLQDKQLFWQIFFEIMDFCFPMTAILMEDIIWEEFKKTNDDIALRIVSKENWLDKKDLHLEKIGYIYSNSNRKYISDCRGISIWLTLKFYMQFIYNFGEMNSKSEPFFDYTNDIYMEYIDKKIKNCIGNDSVRMALSGKHLDENPQFNLNNCMVYNADNMTTQKMVKLVFEDILLFANSHDINIDDLNASHMSHCDLNIHYFNMDSLAQAVGVILFYSKELYGKATQQLEIKIKNLETKNAQLENENTILKNKITDLSNNTKNINLEEVQALKDEINNINELLESKQSIINGLVQKNKELTSYIDNIFNEDDISDKEIEENISIEEMISYLNDFSFTLIGGRIDLLQKLNDLGWTNIIQFDHRNKNKLSGNIPLSDFYVVNTKFISHTLVNRVESLDNLSETLIYYNGTNIDKLIFTCYHFLKNYLE